MQPSQANFYHPYQPYEIQLQFMRGVYQCLQDGQVALFESPTGTGKSLSLICGTVTWLRDHLRSVSTVSLAPETLEPAAVDGDDWLVQAEFAARRKELLRESEEWEEKLAVIRQKESALISVENDRRSRKKQRRDPVNKVDRSSQHDEEFLLEDYASESESTSNSGQSNKLSSATQALIDKLGPSVAAQETETKEDSLKIIFCSRTHSQLSQLVGELRRVKPPSRWSSAQPLEQENRSEEPIKHLSLGSRKHLCINPKVSNLQSISAVNDRCLELQKPGLAKDQKCQFLPQKDDRGRLEQFRDRSLATIQDIEGIADIGRHMQLCPYYATRSAIAYSEVLTVPYPLLLSNTAREAAGINVSGNVIVIDEAHNLADAISNIFSMSMSLKHVERATQQIMTYVQRFKHRLKGSNRTYITQIIRILNSVSDNLQHLLGKDVNKEVIVTASQLMSGKGVDQIRPHKLLHYIIQSKLSHKIEGYWESREAVARGEQSKGMMLEFQSLLTVMINPAAEGRFFASRQDGEISLRYTLLDPKEHFRSIVQEARAVILAGGTMSPMSDYVDYLFPYLDSRRLTLHSFGHVIPVENLFTRTLATAPDGSTFEFSFEKRNSMDMIRALGLAVLRFCRVIPDGVVIFFPSYDYLSSVVQQWRKQIADLSIFDQITVHKVIFEESRGCDVDALLHDYTHTIETNKGALLLSVVGGKLSEGINFSDRLGRCVIAVGLPFPNLHGAEWKAKMEYIEQVKYTSSRQQGETEDQSMARAKSAARDFYENACMRAVNQSIGRAIRHRNDYAAIILVDKRYDSARIQHKLPTWIRDNIAHSPSADIWRHLEPDLQAFFANRQ